jgi:hypothetical protein
MKERLRKAPMSNPPCMYVMYGSMVLAPRRSNYCIRSDQGGRRGKLALLVESMSEACDVVLAASCSVSIFLSPSPAKVGESSSFLGNLSLAASSHILVHVNTVNSLIEIPAQQMTNPKKEIPLAQRGWMCLPLFFFFFFFFFTFPPSHFYRHPLPRACQSSQS